MKKLLLFISFTLVAIGTWASKANPTPMTMIQSDGTKLTVMGFGDEHESWYTTTDGVLLAHVGMDFYIANIDKDGELTSSTQLAHERTLRNTIEASMVKLQNRDAFFSEAAIAKREARRRITLGTDHPNYFPHTGSPRAIVILVNFQDTTFTLSDPKTTFDQYLNGTTLNDLSTNKNTNYGSVQKYFSDISFGTFTPQFDVVGPVTVSQNMAYYGANGTKVKDLKHQEMVREACNLAASQSLVNFSDSKYDSDNDSYVDMVYIIYAGYGENTGGSSNSIWAKVSTLSSTLTFNGKTICRYGVSNELNYNPSYYEAKGIATPYINGIGVFCHEFSHGLGLADIYSYNVNARVDNQAMEYWDLMDGGEYVQNGYCPTPYTAWEREVLGWPVTIEDLTSPATITAKTVNSGGSAYRIVNSEDPAEYFMLENTQRAGWSRYVPGHGLLVYHVKWPTSVVNYDDNPNDTKGQPGMAVVPADSIVGTSYNIGTQVSWGTENDTLSNGTIIRGIATSSDYVRQHYGDPFPGTKAIKALHSGMKRPNWTWYTTTSTVSQTLTNITEDTSAGTVTFDFNLTNGIKGVFMDSSSVSNAIYSIDGRYLGTDKNKLGKGIYIINHKKIVIR
jgi:immune inhibitor A